MENKSIIHSITNEKLSAIIFVLDYLQLDFDGKRLSCYIFPEISINSNLFNFNDIGYRDSLCKLLARNVTSTSVVKGTGITIYFEEDYIHIPFNKSNIGEVAFYIDEDSNWDSFTDDED